MGRKDSAPKPPDPKQTSAAQTGTNVSTGIANTMMGMVDQRTPYGSLSYQQTGSHTQHDPFTGKNYDIPRFTAVTELSPTGQKLQNQQTNTQLNLGRLAQSQSGRLNNLLSRPMNMKGLPQRGQFDKDFGRERQRVENALMQRMMPQMNRDRDQLRTELANQGLGIGSEAYTDAMRDESRGRNDARLAAILGAGQEHSRLAQLDLAGAQFQDNRRATALGERYAQRNQPINEIMSLMSGSQVQQPQFQNTPVSQIVTTDNAALIANDYAARTRAHEQQQANRGGFLSGLGGLFGTALDSGIVGVPTPLLTLSDERVKDDKEKIGETKDGLGIYSYRYKGSPRTEIGLMAQEVKKRKPDAVQTGAGGIMAVDYGKALS